MKIKVQNQIKSAHQSSKLKYKSKIKTLFQVQSEIHNQYQSSNDKMKLKM